MAAWRDDAMTRGGHGSEAEKYVIERLRGLAGWLAMDANAARPNQPGFDVLGRHENGRELRISVKSVSTGGVRCDFGIGRSFMRHPADVYAFVDMTALEPWPVYLAGARTVERLALERHHQYQAKRGRPVDGLNTWSPKISRGLLEAMGAREDWLLLEHSNPSDFPTVTSSMLARARNDTPRPRGGV
jgi:hypothetical protein